MHQRYTAHFQVRSFDIDSWGELSARMLAAYMEQTAWEASDAAGFSTDWYREQGTAWFIRRLTLARRGPIAYQDALAATTWISNIQRVRSSREYELHGPAGALVAAGRADWVYMNVTRGTPTGIDRQIVAGFETGPPTPLLVTPAEAAPLPALGRHFTSTRRAYRAEADSAGHIKNTVYLAWLDEALAEALAAAGLPLAAPARPGLRLQGVWYVVDYLRSALAGDAVAIGSRLIGTANPDLLEWTQEITRSDGEALLRCRSLQQICGLDAGAPRPAGIIKALTSEAGPGI